VRVRIGIVGYGTIGKRVAEAVMRMDDMELVGIVKRNPDYEAEIARMRGLDIYVDANDEDKFRKAGIEVKGTVDELLSKIDVAIDATPGDVGIENKKRLYEPRGLRAIFQGGEEAEVAEVSFNALANYEAAVGRRYVRIVSCNTTGLSRLMSALLLHGYRIRKVRAFIARRGADPREYRRGPINDVVFDPPTVPSHHGPDVNTIIPNVEVITMAVAVPTTLMHLHMVNVEFEGSVSKGEIIRAFEDTPRLILLSAKSRRFESVAQIIEWARDLGRSRGDVYENAVIEDSVTVSGNELYLMQGIHQESIVVPENIDAVRAMFKLADKWSSIKVTDERLGLITRGKSYSIG